MKKLMLIAAMLAMVLALAVPAIAQVGNGVGQESESEEVELSFSVENTGDYAFQCTPATQFGNTGNLQNANAFLQYDSELDDFESGNIEFAFEPENATDCSSTIQQSAAASG